MASARIVLDTNSWISYAFFRAVETAVVQVVRQALEGEIVFIASPETLDELHDVLVRPGWDKYVSLAKRVAFHQRVMALAYCVSVVTTVDECSDPKDNKFLALALDGKAEFIVTGDRDLLALCHNDNGQFTQPWRGIPILSPVNFLQRTAARSSRE